MIDQFLNALTITLVWQVAVIVVTIATWHRSEAVARVPILDFVVSFLTWVPWVVSAWCGGWVGLIGCLLGQVASLYGFVFFHERLRGVGRHTIKGTLNRIVGRTRNHLGLWVTVPALPVFLMIRAAEILMYPWLTRILDFPGYKQSDWVNVSRQKFSGLVGHDLIWCLYCDWMTGVYSLGAEMLRNVESFWCPIKFGDKTKCENCKLDFPDLVEWARADAKMRDVTRLLEEKYPEGTDAPRSWFQHPERRGE